MSFLFSSKQDRRGRSPLPSLPSRKAIHQDADPFTLWHNLRTRPLTFLSACLGLMAVLVVKTILVRSRETTTAPKNP